MISNFAEKKKIFYKRMIKPNNGVIALIYIIITQKST